MEQRVLLPACSTLVSVTTIGRYARSQPRVTQRETPLWPRVERATVLLFIYYDKLPSSPTPCLVAIARSFNSRLAVSFH